MTGLFVFGIVLLVISLLLIAPLFYPSSGYRAGGSAGLVGGVFQILGSALGSILMVPATAIILGCVFGAPYALIPIGIAACIYIKLMYFPKDYLDDLPPEERKAAKERRAAYNETKKSKEKENV